MAWSEPMTLLRYACLAGALLAFAIALAGSRDLRAQPRPTMPEIRLMTLDPGHFHAALVQKSMYTGVSPRVHVFAPLGPDLVAHLGRIAAYNTRRDNPTAWQMEVHASNDYFERMMQTRPGNVVVISGRNRGKIDRILQSVRKGVNVLADKPWVLRSEDLPTLESALATADARRLVAYDIMTERFEITTMLQRALVNDRAVFGEPLQGTPEQPGVYMESVHHLMKMVSGSPNIRPAWFFDTGEQGEGLNDIGTHLVDLVQWTLLPNQPVDYRRDIVVLAAQRWPTMISEADFRRVTGEPGFPDALTPRLKDGSLEYFCNTLVTYRLRGTHVTLNVIWDWEAPEGGGDTHFAQYRGSLSTIEVRQTRSDVFRPEVYVLPAEPADAARLRTALEQKMADLQQTYPGISLDERAGLLHVSIPDTYRVGHEAHFAQVTSAYLEYLRNRDTLPAWERPNMLAKYYVTTTGTEMSRASEPRVAPRLAPQ
jgi:predicted dehydrogenase